MSTILDLPDEIMQRVIIFAGIDATHSLISTCKWIRNQTLQAPTEVFRQMHTHSHNYLIIQHTLSAYNSDRPSWPIIQTICNQLKKTFNCENIYNDLIMNKLGAAEQLAQDESLVNLGYALIKRKIFKELDHEVTMFLRKGNSLHQQASDFRMWLKKNPTVFENIIDLSFPESCKRIPPEIRYFYNLRTLGLDSLKATFLSEEVWSLPELTRLSCASSELQLLNIPKNAQSKIQYLDISKSGISKIPEEIGLLKNLVYFNFSDTKITTLPQSFGNLKNLKTFTDDWEMLTFLPDEVINSSNPLINEAAFEFRWYGKILKNLNKALHFFTEFLKTAFKITATCFEQIMYVIVMSLAIIIYYIKSIIEIFINLAHEYPQISTLILGISLLIICLKEPS